MTHRSKGFTLVEIIVIVALLGILVSVSVALINPSLQLRKSRDAGRKSDISLIQSAVEAYKAHQDVYPYFGTSDAPQYGWYFPNGLSGMSDYLNNIPTGPSGNTCAGGYIYAGSENSYTIFTLLENKSDPDATKTKPIPQAASGSSSDGYKSYTFSAGTCAGTTFNYWVNNP